MSKNVWSPEWVEARFRFTVRLIVTFRWFLLAFAVFVVEFAMVTRLYVGLLYVLSAACWYVLTIIWMHDAVKTRQIRHERIELRRSFFGGL